MSEIFRGCLSKFVLVFFDDILLYSRSMEEHRTHLSHVLQILKTHELFANEKNADLLNLVWCIWAILFRTRVAADMEKVDEC